MNDEFNKQNFDILMEKFVQLDTKLKQDKIIEEIKFLIAYQTKLCMLNQAEFDIMYNKEISDINGENVSEKDFLEALYAYLYILKSANFKFVDSLANRLSELSNFKVD